MKSIQIAIAATTLLASIAATGLVQASEISEFPVANASTVSRAEVRAQAEAANKAGLLRYDFVGPAGMPGVEPMSQKSREEVRKQAVERTGPHVVNESNVGGS